MREHLAVNRTKYWSVPHSWLICETQLSLEKTEKSQNDSELSLHSKEINQQAFHESNFH